MATTASYEQEFLRKKKTKGQPRTPSFAEVPNPRSGPLAGNPTTPAPVVTTPKKTGPVRESATYAAPAAPTTPQTAAAPVPTPQEQAQQMSAPRLDRGPDGSVQGVSQATPTQQIQGAAPTYTQPQMTQDQANTMMQGLDPNDPNATLGVYANSLFNDYNTEVLTQQANQRTDQQTAALYQQWVQERIAAGDSAINNSYEEFQNWLNAQQGAVGDEANRVRGTSEDTYQRTFGQAEGDRNAALGVFSRVDAQVAQTKNRAETLYNNAMARFNNIAAMRGQDMGKLDAAGAAALAAESDLSAQVTSEALHGLEANAAAERDQVLAMAKEQGLPANHPKVREMLMEVGTRKWEATRGLAVQSAQAVIDAKRSVRQAYDTMKTELAGTWSGTMANLDQNLGQIEQMVATTYGNAGATLASAGEALNNAMNAATGIQQAAGETRVLGSVEAGKLVDSAFQTAATVSAENNHNRNQAMIAFNALADQMQGSSLGALAEAAYQRYVPTAGMTGELVNMSLGLHQQNVSETYMAINAIMSAVGLAVNSYSTLWGSGGGGGYQPSFGDQFGSSFAGGFGGGMSQNLSQGFWDGLFG